MPSWEIKFTENDVRVFSEEGQIIQAVLANEIKPDYECRCVPVAADNAKAQEAKWRKVSDSLAKSSFAVRVLFQPIWAHTVYGAGIGATLGLVWWFGSGVFVFFSLAFAAAPFDAHKSSNLFCKFAATGAVFVFWLVNSIHLLSLLALPKAFQKVTGNMANKAFGGVVLALVLIGFRGDISGIFAGVVSGLQAAFGAFLAGALAGVFPGMIIGTSVGMWRHPNLRKSPAVQNEAMLPVLVKGLLLPALAIVLIAVLYVKYAPQLIELYEHAIGK